MFILQPWFFHIVHLKTSSCLDCVCVCVCRDKEDIKNDKCMSKYLITVSAESDGNNNLCCSAENRNRTDMNSWVDQTVFQKFFFHGKNWNRNRDKKVFLCVPTVIGVFQGTQWQRQQMLLLSVPHTNALCVWRKNRWPKMRANPRIYSKYLYTVHVQYATVHCVRVCNLSLCVCWTIQGVVTHCRLQLFVFKA